MGGRERERENVKVQKKEERVDQPQERKTATQRRHCGHKHRSTNSASSRQQERQEPIQSNVQAHTYSHRSLFRRRGSPSISHPSSLTREKDKKNDQVEEA